MTSDRNRNGRRGGRKDGFQPDGGKLDVGVGYWDEREAALTEKAYREAFEHRPNNTEAEAALLGAMMIDNRWVEPLSAFLKPAHFFEPAHARIYERIVSLVLRGQLATPVTLRPYFEGEIAIFEQEEGGQKQPEVNMAGYLATLTGSGAGLIGARAFAEQIVDLAWLREIILRTRDIAAMAKNTAEEVNPRAIIQFAEEQMFEVASYAERGDRRTASTFASAWDEAEAEMEEIAAGKPVEGVLIDGYEDWNQVVGRMVGGDLVLLGGRPGMGKTAVACAVAVGAASAGHATEYVSLEMTRKKLARRMIANMIYEQHVTSGYAALGQGRLIAEDRENMRRARAAIESYPLDIHDPDSMAVEELHGFIVRMKRKWAKKDKKLTLVIVENMDLFGTARHFQNPVDRISHISRTCKTIAKQTGVTLLVLVQLNRAVESRDDKHPVLSDLRQSGSLEQDADTVVFLYRDEYYLRQAEPNKADEKKWSAWSDEMAASRDRIELYATKVREGALTKRTGYFFAEAQALRSSEFYRSDLFRAGSNGGFRMADAGNAGGFGEA